MADVYIAPPAVPVLNSASSQADGLIHWFPHRPGYEPEKDYVSGTSGALSGSDLGSIVSKFGVAQITDGDDYRYIDSISTAFNPLTGVTLSAWVYHTVPGFGGEYPVRIGGAINTDNRCFLGVQPAGNRRMYFTSNNGTTALSPQSEASVTAPTGEWYHLCGTADETAGDRRLYFNGALIATETSAGLDFSAQAWQKIGIAGADYVSQAGADGGVVGYMMDGRIYNKALTAAEVAAMYATATRWELWEGEPKFADETLEVFFFRRRRRLC